MKLGLINSAWVQAQQPTVFGLRKTKEIGFDTVDIFVDPLDLDVRERRLIKDECDLLELPIVSLACVAVGLIDFNPSVRAFHERRVGAYLDLAYEYEAKNVLLVIGEYIWNKEVIPPEEQWRCGVEAVRRLGRRAGELGLEIVLELEPFGMSLVNDIDSMVRFLDDVDVPAVKANIDISHLVLSHVEPAQLRRLKGRAGHVHGDRPAGHGGRHAGVLPPLRRTNLPRRMDPSRNPLQWLSQKRIADPWRGPWAAWACPAGRATRPSART